MVPSINFFLMILTVCLYLINPFSISIAKGEVITINEAYELALKTHERIMISKKEVEKSELLPKRALSVMLPLAEIEGSWVKYKDEIRIEGIDNLSSDQGPVALPSDEWRGDFIFEQPLYQAEFFSLRRQAFKSIDRTTQDYYMTIQDTLFEVATAYYEVLEAYKLVENAKETLRLAEEELRVAKVRFEVGEVTRTAVLRAEVDVSQAQRNIIETQNNLQLAKDTLGRLIGIEGGKIEVVEPAPIEKIDKPYEALVDKALNYRYDYKMAQLGVDIAKEDKNLVKARYHPHFSAVWGYHRLSPESFIERDDFWDATIRVSIPIFERATRIWDFKERQRNLNQANLAEKQLKKDIRIEVEDAMLSVRTYESILVNLEREMALNEENYRIIFEQFKVGLATSLDLTDALTKLDSARTILITNTYGYQVALLDLKRAIGLFAQEYMETHI
jgi:outer membrane protein TolC